MLAGRMNRLHSASRITRYNRIVSPLPQEWASALDSLDYALQPIVCTHTGECLGFECLLRGYDAAGFESIPAVFDKAYADRILHTLDLALREKAIVKFVSAPGHRSTKLFVNLDIRTTEAPDYSPGATRAILEQFGLSPSSVCFEISEQQRVFNGSAGDSALHAYRAQGFSIAIDDYGIGFSGLKRLYECETDYIKIDGFFLEDIDTSSRKRLFVSHMVGLAHVLGIKVIAEHVVTESQFYGAKTAGCDFLQGFLVERPVQETSKLKTAYEAVLRLNRRERREPRGDRGLVLGQVQYVRPLHCDATMAEVLEAFRQNPTCAFIPVVNDLHEPLGTIREREIKEYVYSRYGRELMVNPAMSGRLREFMTKCPLADISLDLDKMIEVFSSVQNAELLLLTDGTRYRGYLSASALLMTLNEKNLAVARDQNPLTRLPGNSLIAEYVGRTLRTDDHERVFVYFDLDNFKAFNDTYGFRQGDRAILLLADTLKEAAHGREVFLGHVGGDDLFAAFSGPDCSLERVREWATEVVEHYNRDVLSLFNAEDRTRGHLFTTDRSGVERAVPLLTVSCALLAIPSHAPAPSADALGVAMARGKRAAKQRPDKMHVESFDPHHQLLSGLHQTSLLEQIQETANSA